MNLQQFRFVQEAVRRQLNLTETAKALFTSQPGVSKAILELEAELGIDIFARHGKRLKRVTEPGQQVLKSIDLILREVTNLKRIGEEYALQDAGTLSIATTHLQARYFLPPALAQLRQRYPRVQVLMHQGLPDEVTRMLLDDVAEVGLATEAPSVHSDLITLPCHEWQHVLIVPAGHRLAQEEPIALAQLATHSLALYQQGMAGRARIDQAFANAGLKPAVTLEALDSDVIKTGVRLGLGVGIVAEQCMQDEPPKSDLVARPLGHLFGANHTHLAFKRGVYLRRFVLAFAEMLSPRLNAALIERAMQGQGSDHQI